MSLGVKGKSFPVFAAGIRYKSIYEAAMETNISTVWLLKSLSESEGGPCVIKNTGFVSEAWILKRKSAREACSDGRL